MTLTQLYSIYKEHPQVCTDTRRLVAGSIYFALRGASFDGNQFASQALRAGCAYAVVDDPALCAEASTDNRLLPVDDVLQTLQQLATLHRRTLGTPILQITGTNGKTTTKELTAAVLSRSRRTLLTEGNLNNHIGVPLTLLRLRAEDRFAVVETGANHPGEIQQLSRIVQPDYGLITNVGMAHLEGFGSLQGVVHTKTELYRHLAENRAGQGIVFVCGDNELLTPHVPSGLETVTYGQPLHGYDIEGEAVSAPSPCEGGDSLPLLRMRWRKRGGEWHEVQTHLVGDYNAQNALAAAAVGLRMGVSEAAVCAALADYVPSNNRSMMKHTEHATLIVDAYNANPTSMRAALHSFAQMKAPHRLAILGEMRELGEASEQAHQDVVGELAALGIDEAWLVGENFRQPASEAGLRHFADVEAVRRELRHHPLLDSLVLIKGSNATRLYSLVEEF